MLRAFGVTEFLEHGHVAPIVLFGPTRHNAHHLIRYQKKNTLNFIPTEDELECQVPAVLDKQDAAQRVGSKLSKRFR